MPADNKQSNAGYHSSIKGGCGCFIFLVFGLTSLGALAADEPGMFALYSFCAFVGLIVCLWGVLGGAWEANAANAEKRYGQEYAKLLAEFKLDGMNEANYEKIVLYLNDGKYQGELNVATAPPEKIQRFYEVLSIRYYALLNRLKTVDLPALRSELLNVGRNLQKLTLNPFNSEWSEQRLANDLAVLSSAAVHSGSSGNVAVQIEKLGELYKSGVITQEEFDRGKALFLGNPPDVAAKTLNILDGLHKLKTNGALSESEYNVKKWELLSGKNLNPK